MKNRNSSSEIKVDEDPDGLYDYYYEYSIYEFSENDHITQLGFIQKALKRPVL